MKFIVFTGRYTSSIRWLGKGIYEEPDVWVNRRGGTLRMKSYIS